MTKRISLIAVVVCGFAAVCGIVFGGVSEDSSKYPSGPGLISDRFFQLFNSTNFGLTVGKIELDHPRVQPIPGRNVVLIARIKRYAEGNYGVIWQVSKNSYAMYLIDFATYQSSKISLHPQESMRLKELNRRVDKIFFPNIETREKEKIEVLRKLEEFSKIEVLNKQ